MAAVVSARNPRRKWRAGLGAWLCAAALLSAAAGSACNVDRYAGYSEGDAAVDAGGGRGGGGGGGSSSRAGAGGSGAGGPCAVANGGCSPLVECTEADGKALCGPCPAGTADPSRTGRQCVDIDECALGLDDCDDDPQAVCFNAQQTYQCHCPAGFLDADPKNPGRDCQPLNPGGMGGMGATLMDECALDTDGCDADPEACVDMAEGFACICPTGYADVNGDGSRCENVDECVLGADFCDLTPAASCSDTVGAYTCACPAGYEDPTGRSCHAVCGDGRVLGGEQCDDDDTDDGDGCSKTCALEAGYDCTADEPTVCVTQCGNGRRDEGEACDDDDLQPGDGCDASCRVEATHVCAGFPSRCFTHASVAVVDDGATECPGAGTAASPYCSLTAALASPRAIFVVRPGEYRENVDIQNRALEIVAEEGALLLASSNAAPALRIAAGAELTISGLSIRGGSTRVSVEDSQATIRESQIGPGASGAGLRASGSASVTLSRTRVAGNPGGGVDLGGSGTFRIEHSVVHGNGSTDAGQAFGGIRVGAQAPGSTLVHVTVADNLAAASEVAGIRCDVPNVTVTNAIVWGNRAGAAASGVSAACTTTYSSVDPAASGTGNVSMDPDFVLPTYHLSGNSPLIDRGDPATPASTDYDGRPRPQGARGDLGAYEVGPSSPFPAGRSDALFALDERTRKPAYLGLYPTGLYPSSSYVMPGSHKSAGLDRANAIATLDIDGVPNPDGRVVFLTLGGSDVAEAVCSESLNLPAVIIGPSPLCSGSSVLGHTELGPAEPVDHDHATIINGAYPNQYAEDFTQDDEPVFQPVPANANIAAVSGNYDRIRTHVLDAYVTTPVSEAQVQAIFVELANEAPIASLPDRHADAVELMVRLGNVLRYAKVRYPNLKIALLSSRPYSPASARAPREPFAYESGLAVKWLIAAQIAQMENAGTIVDTRAGDLSYDTGVAPWIGWGPYLWNHPKGSQTVGARWYDGDFEDTADGFFSARGEAKAALILLRDFTLSPFLKCWLLTVGSCS